MRKTIEYRHGDTYIAGRLKSLAAKIEASEDDDLYLYKDIIEGLADDLFEGKITLRKRSDNWTAPFIQGPQNEASPKEMVNGPKHYDGDGCYKWIRSVMSEEMFKGFLLGNVLKYLYRAGRKEGNPAAQEYGKSEWYLNRLHEIESGENGE